MYRSKITVQANNGWVFEEFLPNDLRLWNSGIVTWTGHYFFFGFCLVGLKVPLMNSSTASPAMRSIFGRVLFSGKANGWPKFQSVLFFCDCLVFFFVFFAIH
jgi:hypothetical protein